MSVPELPPELWQEIIYFATRLPSWCHPLTSASITPFLVNPEDNLAAHKATLEIRARIVLVSRQWNTFGTTFLYEFIQLSRSSTFAGLSGALEHRKSEVKRGSLVRAAIISYEPVVQLPYSVILTQLPNLQVIIHAQWRTPPDYDRASEINRLPSFLKDSQSPTLRSVLGNIKRIECYEHPAPDTDISSSDLRQSMRMCKNIQYLSVRGVPAYVPARLPFKSLETLRIDPHPDIPRSQSSHHQLLRWSMPNLRNVVIHIQCMRSEPLCALVLSQFGANLHTIELAISSDTLPQHDGNELSHILYHCPQLQDLSYHIEVCRSPVFPHGPHTSLAQLRLYAGYAGRHAAPEHKLSNNASSHFYAYTHRTAPNLKRLLCYGKWKGRIPRIQGILETFVFEWDRGAVSKISDRPPIIEFVG